MARSKAPKAKQDDKTAQAKKAAKATAKAARKDRFAAIRTTLGAAVKADKTFIPVVALAFLVVTGAFIALGIAIGHPILLAVPGVMFGLVAALAVAGRKAAKTAFAGIEGQPGAAYSVLMSMRGHWHVTPAVQVTRSQDLVHRVVGRPGVILVGEGSGGRPRELIGAEARRLRRVIGETPLYDVVVGERDGEITLRKLQGHLMKLPRNIKPKQVNDLEAKLKAMGGSGIPIPKGPVPGMTNMRRPPRNMR